MPNGKTTAPGGQEPTGAPSGKRSDINGNRSNVKHRYEMFAQHYALYGNATEAALVAGYSSLNASTKGYKLLGIACVRERIDQLTKERIEKYKDDKRKMLLDVFEDLATSRQRGAVVSQAREILAREYAIGDKNGGSGEDQRVRGANMGRVRAAIAHLRRTTRK